MTSDQRKYEFGAEAHFFGFDSQTRLAQAVLVLPQTQISCQIALASVGHATGNLFSPCHLKMADRSK